MKLCIQSQVVIDNKNIIVLDLRWEEFRALVDTLDPFQRADGILRRGLPERRQGPRRAA
jgi:hypothetical protein